MKKSIYFLMMFAGLAFTSCEPMEDIHDEIDAELEARPTVGTAEFTFTDEDYETLDLGFGSFDSEDDAKEMIPALLSEKYPVWGEGSIAVVSFEVYNPSVEVENLVEREVTEEEYLAYGFKYKNFDSADDMVKYLSGEYPDAAEGDAVELSYVYYAGTAGERTTTHVFLDGSWVQAVTLERADYTEMGESFPNFSSRNDAIADLSVFLGMRFPYAKADDVKAVIYDLHVGGGKTEKHLQLFTFNGEDWITDGNTYEATMQFGHDGATWVPDNTIVHTLTPSDFAFIGTALADKYEDPAWSAGNYSNFDRRVGNRNEWTDDMLVEAMAVLLDEIAPNAEEGQKYTMIFAIYNGANGTEQLNMIKTGGEWVKNQ